MSTSRKAESSALWRTRRRWTADDAEAAFAAQARSGLSLACFAAREGLEVHRLYRWSRRLEDTGDRLTGFVEVTAAVAARGEVRFDVVLRSGQTVRVPEGFDAQELRRLIAVLEEASQC
jgi:transposase-like protein